MGLQNNQQDVAAGCLCMVIGAAGFFWSFSYAMGTLHRMGPGYFPALAFGLLALSGVVVFTRALFRPGERLERWSLRPLVVVLASVVVFGLIVESFGFVLSSGLLVIMASFAGTSLKPLQILALATGLTLFCVLVFVVALNLPMPIWPEFVS